MGDVALGKVTTTAGVPVVLAVEATLPSWLHSCHSYMVEVLPTNTGKVYIGDSQAMNRTTFAHVLAWLPPPTANSAPSYTATISSAPNGMSVVGHWLDVDNDGDGAIVSIAVN